MKLKLIVGRNRKIFLFILFFPLFSILSCATRSIVITEIDIKEEALFLENEDQPYSGVCIIMYDKTKTVQQELTYKNGFLNGSAVSYYPDGSVKRKGNYTNGNIDGKWIFWDELGNKSYEVNYINDTLNGIFLSYFPDGSIKEKGNYLKDTRQGKWTFYNEQGEIINEKTYP
ncbi:MAG: toxin-antitoxin system YwqK family antitoxin [Bacteroidales bacterium]|nr:toxin-antitoxin system YwqK family antitoxin [Bacteroidales bacterium]